MTYAADFSSKNVICKLKAKLYSKKAEDILQYVARKLKKKHKIPGSKPFDVFVRREDDGELFLEASDDLLGSMLELLTVKDCVEAAKSLDLADVALNEVKSQYIGCPMERAMKAEVVPGVLIVELLCLIDIAQESSLDRYPAEMVKALVGTPRDPLTVQCIFVLRSEIAKKNQEMLTAFLNLRRKQQEEQYAIKEKYKALMEESDARFKAELKPLTERLDEILKKPI